MGTIRPPALLNALSPQHTIVAPLPRLSHRAAPDVFEDSHLVEFLGLPDVQGEADRRHGPQARLKDFPLEPGPDFRFAGSESPLLGWRARLRRRPAFFDVDSTLVAVGLEIGRFGPEYPGKQGFHQQQYPGSAG